MIHTLFVVNGGGDVIFEKHYRAPIARSVLDAFFEAHTKAGDPEEVPPCIPSSRHYLINVYRERLFFIAVIQSEVPPLMVISLLHRIIDTFADYFGQCTEKKLQQETVIVYQVLEEMLDNGFPLTTELNILKEMVRPPTWMEVLDPLSGAKRVKETLPTGQLTNMQWRRQGVRYGNNEIFIDVIEHLDAVVDRNGTTISAEIEGKIMCKCRLSGTPDLLMTLINPHILDDVSFHPCVRLQKWAAEKVISFVPPDGVFELSSYLVGAQHQIALPVYVKPVIIFSEANCKLDIEVGLKQSQGKQIEELTVVVPMPKSVNSVNCTPSAGTWTFDQITKTLRWELKKAVLERPVNLRGPISVAAGEPLPDCPPTVSVVFRIPHFASSGLKVNRLDLLTEKYKPFKGVKYTTIAGKFQVRA